MNLDRSKFLQLVTVLAAGACGPAAAPPATSGSPTTNATNETTTAATSAPTTTTTEGATSGPSAEGIGAGLGGSGCDYGAIGPCSEGGSSADACHGIADALDPARRAAFFACTKKKLGDVSDKACAVRAHKCGATSARCRDTSKAVDACQQKIQKTCAEAPETKKETACFEKCFGAAKSAKNPSKAIMACATSCGGEPGTAEKTCVSNTTAKECRSANDDNSACAATMNTDCAIGPGCVVSLNAACKAASATFATCGAS